MSVNKTETVKMENEALITERDERDVLIGQKVVELVWKLDMDDMVLKYLDGVISEVTLCLPGGSEIRVLAQVVMFGEYIAYTQVLGDVIDARETRYARLHIESQKSLGIKALNAINAALAKVA